MIRERLQSIPLEQLESLARSEGIELAASVTKQVLIDLILENYEEAKKERTSQNNLSIQGEVKKYEIAAEEQVDSRSPEEYMIPERYNETRVTFMLRDPNWAFAYWEIDEKQMHQLKAQGGFEQLLLRVHDVELIDFDGSNSNSYFDIPIKPSDSNWYIYLPHQDCHYVLELGCTAKGRYHLIARSNVIHTPRRSLSDAGVAVDIAPYLTDVETLQLLSSADAIPQRIISRIG